jgi:hypothetical protein
LRRASSHALDTALGALGLFDAYAIGACFRQLQERRIGPFLLKRDKRGWSLTRV